MCSYIYAPFLPNFSLGVLNPQGRSCMRDFTVVYALGSGSSGSVSSPGLEHCVLFLDKTLNSHSASLHSNSSLMDQENNDRNALSVEDLNFPFWAKVSVPVP